jgi:hypothetical protein
MSRATPQAAYGTAREAMRRQDWPAVFACLDVSDLKKIAGRLSGARRHYRPGTAARPAR